MSERKMIYATATSGPALAICPSCRKVVGNTTVALTAPFYPDLGNDQVPSASTSEMLLIEFEPFAYCQCKREVTAKYRLGQRVKCEVQGVSFTGKIAQSTATARHTVYHVEAEYPNGKTTPLFVEESEILGLAEEGSKA